MSKTRIESINALAELDRVSWSYEPVGNEEVKCKCPVHEDNSPSVRLNTAKNLWKCFASHCNAQGDIATFIAHVLKVERSTVIIDLSSRYDLEDVKVISPATVEKFHDEIFNAGPLLQALRDRGITDDMIRKARLGFHKGRITIPIYDQNYNVVNVRRYLPGAPGAQKMQNTTGYGAARIYQIDQLLKYDKVWLCGGEMKALVVGSYLNDLGIGAICVSAGEGAWEPKWNSLLANKEIFICMDVDLAGRIATRKLGQYIYQHAKSVRVIDLPLDKKKYPKGDVNDYVGQEHAKPSDLHRLTSEARIFEPQIVGLKGTVSDQITPVSLARATDPENVGKRVGFLGVVSAMDTTPFLIPSKVGVICDRAQKNCAMCPISTLDQDPDEGSTDVNIPATSIAILDMINNTKGKQNECLQEALGIPTCRVVKFSIKKHYQVRDVRLAPQLSIGSEGSDNVVQSAFVVGTDVDLNASYNLSGVVYPHPKTQQATLLLDEVEEAEDSLGSFDPSEEELAELSVFQPKEWTVEGIQAKLEEIYDDLECNVTRVYSRREILTLVDLTYHSVLVFQFDGSVTTGWVNSLIAGDSAQGKSEMTIKLKTHYGLGERMECKNATVAGLLGGLQQMGSKWFVSWGIIPMHDRRLVLLEEVKGAPVEVIGKLTDMRSSGQAEIPKIERRRAQARTRLIFISNPRSPRPVSSYNFGVEMIQELIGALEDVRRFDVAVIVAKEQVDPKLINRMMKNRPIVEHKFTNDLCRRLVLYAWTRKQHQVEFAPEATSLIMECANALCEKYTETFPLVDRGTMRYKLARLATALAVRTFSHGESQDVVLVRACHVHFIQEFLDKVYSAKEFGYLDFSKAQSVMNNILDVKTIEKHLFATKHPKDLISSFLLQDRVSLEDLMVWAELDRDGAYKLLSLLVRKHALLRSGREYIKSTPFIDLLRKMKNVPEKPKVREEDEF